MRTRIDAPSWVTLCAADVTRMLFVDPFTLDATEFEPVTPSSVDPARLPPRRALVADDARVMRALVYTWLSGLGFDVTLAKDGVAALAQVRKAEFDIVLLDINMPGLTGLTVLDSIRHDPRTKTLPVVLLTTLGHASDFDRGLALGASAYLTKPLSLGRLVSTVNRVLPPRPPPNHPSAIKS